ncbi:MAG: DctP family TRAP transporter solute-binding subunit [Clostridiales Family XIII bacterium]|jgi:tripartite ATP-independent transporter DctP family solute receptor|nr:DctP family TRAP transporter solute-binding subunit [Clostridiales Family XIII bacterium]
MEKRMKNVLIFVFAAMLLFATVACGGGAAQTDSQDDAAQEESQDATAGGGGDAEPIVLKVASTVQDDSPGGALLFSYFEPEIEKRSEGRIDVQVYNNSVLGGDRQLYEALQLGTLEISLGPLSTLTNFDQKFGASDLPFLYKDKATAYEALDGEWGDMLKADLPNVDMRILSYCENAFRDLSNNVRPIKTLEDMKGLKIRVMESPMYISTFKALGANPTPIPFSELYTALQQGTVDGQDNGVVLTCTAKLNEVLKYYTISGQVYAAAALVAGEKWWQGLPADLQQIVQEVSDGYRDRQREEVVGIEAEYQATIEAGGTEVYVLPPEEKERFKQACMGVWDEFADTYGSEIMAAAKEVNDKYGN